MSNGNGNGNGLFIKRRRWLPPDLRSKNRYGGGGGGSGGGLVVPSAPAPSGIPVSPLSDFETQSLDYLKSSNYDLDILRMLNVIGRTITPRVYSITTAPIQIIKATDPKGYIVLNPSRTAGLTSTGSVLASAAYLANAVSTTQATPIGVANYDRMALFLNITVAGGGTVRIDTETQDPVSGLWAISQNDIFTIPSAVGTYYANVGNIGVDTNFAIKYTIGAGGGVTFSLGYVLKDGLAGSASGISRTVYLGNQGVSTVAGYDLLEGQKFEKYFLQNAELWAVSGVSGGITIKCFELS
jgi:hypothetical protein